MLRCRAIIQDALYTFVRSAVGLPTAVPHAQRLLEIVRLLRQEYTKRFSSDELAEMAGLSRSRFRVLFKEMTGCAVTQYQNQIRINKARELLLSGEFSVTDAAEAVGFDEVYYFSRLFRKVTGFSPTHFRNR